MSKISSNPPPAPMSMSTKPAPNVVYQLITLLCDIEYADISSFSVEGNTYFEFNGDIPIGKYKSVVAYLSGCNQKLLTVLTNDIDVESGGYNLNLSLELILHAEEENMTYHIAEERENYFKGLTDEQKEVYRMKYAILK